MEGVSVEFVSDEVIEGDSDRPPTRRMPNMTNTLSRRWPSTNNDNNDHNNDNSDDNEINNDESDRDYTEYSESRFDPSTVEDDIDDTGYDSTYFEGDITSGLNRINLLSQFFNEIEHNEEPESGNEHNEQDERFDFEHDYDSRLEIVQDTQGSTVVPSNLRPIELRRSNAIRRENTSFTTPFSVPFNRSNLRRSRARFALPIMDSTDDLSNISKLNKVSSLKIEKFLTTFKKAFKNSGPVPNPILKCYITHEYTNWNNYDLDFKLSKFLKHNRNVKKRRHIDNGNSKRRKLNAGTKSIGDVKDLNPETNFQEVGLCSSSYCCEGSSFDCKNLNIIINKVDYSNLELGLVFTALPPNCFSSLRQFSKFIIPKNSENSKLQVLGKMMEYIETVDGAATKFQSKLFHYPITGQLVDFKSTDLRSLMDESVRTMQTVKSQNHKIRSQLLCWLKLNPFKQFKAQLFKKFLDHVFTYDSHILNRYVTLNGLLENFTPLKDYLTLNKEQQEILENMHKMNDTLDSFMFKVFYYRNHWECKLVHHLIEFLTCERHCLSNLLLNYNMFKVSLNLDDYLDTYLEYLFELFPHEELKKRFNKCSKTNEMVMIFGSIDRKFGNLQLAVSDEDNHGLINAITTRGNSNQFNIGGGSQVYSII